MNNNISKYLSEDQLGTEICIVVGTRPGIIMLAPVIHEMQRRNLPHFVLHTGQHYSPAMDTELFDDLDLVQPTYRLEGVAEKVTHAGQTGEMMVGVETILMERRPKIVLVGGDANTNLAAALAARKLRIAVGHIEAGERSFDWRMPEEHNRRIIDHISDLLFTTNEKGKEQLEKEHVLGKIHITGNTIVDASVNHAKIAERKASVLSRYDLIPNSYIVLTTHREENVDDLEKLKEILEGAGDVAIQSGLPVVFLAHPRTEKRIEQFGLSGVLEGKEGVQIIPALRYLEFLQILSNARLILTDSGGVQQEAYIAGKPCVTLRDNTEWTETLENGGNRLAGANRDTISHRVTEALSVNIESWPTIFGDGDASNRIIDSVCNFLDG